MGAHGLTMVFYVVIPFFFGFLANFLIPYHVGSKDVAFPRLNSLGFWFLPSGFLLLSKPAFVRTSFFKHYDKPSFYYTMIDFKRFRGINKKYNESFKSDLDNFKKINNVKWDERIKIPFEDCDFFCLVPLLTNNFIDLVS